ncbi:hypothetical protein SIN8267_00609 [Sinobacterium norvegicum]|uniref:Co-chaperone DjlA N-terminal domain-containing protein n=1 Tax=Sinobacterium norvegicum TaxID=1641715 RepID=A0ABM9AC93_9GAMM|nr:TerB family tellurite resistance protein [Sinobacterium norvegicum]CAH0990517.1 hypothetical protein SIN8267_00609 [Sinobacterium norvegicum]
MFKRLADLFSPVEQEQQQDSLELAACALLLELSMADNTVTEAEIAVSQQAMEALFGLSHEAIEDITVIAKQRRSDSADLYSFTKLITEHYSAEQRRQFIYKMWLVAYADGELDKYEDSLIRKVSELIYVPHSAFIQTKLEAEQSYRQ